MICPHSIEKDRVCADCAESQVAFLRERRDATHSPHDYRLDAIPFIGTLGRIETEFTAAVIIRVCQFRDAWGPVEAREVGELIHAETRWGQRHAWWTASIGRMIDVDALIENGFARLIGDELLERQRPIELTPLCFEKLEPYARRLP
jgi:hypothetical protein